MGLPKGYRLKHWQDFKTVYRKGLRFHGRSLVLFALQETPSPTQIGTTQIGISISRKVSKKAVVRNRIKRRLRHCCLRFLPQLQPGWKIIIVVRHSAIECEYSDFLRELEKLFIQAEVLDGH